MDNGKIDFSKTVDSDDIEIALAPLRGVLVLLTALELSADFGENQYQKYAYTALSLLCHETLKEFEKIKLEVDYMQNKIREKS
jgi:hypothetical protein